MQNKLNRIEDFVTPVWIYPGVALLKESCFRYKSTICNEICYCTSCSTIVDRLSAGVCNSSARNCKILLRHDRRSEQSFALAKPYKKAERDIAELGKSRDRSCKQKIVLPLLCRTLSSCRRSVLQIEDLYLSPSYKSSICKTIEQVKVSCAHQIHVKPCFSKPFSWWQSHLPLRAKKKLCCSSCCFAKQNLKKAKICNPGRVKPVKIFWSASYKTSYMLARPLLTCSRDTITKTCFLGKLPVYPDLSNFDVRYSRNRIRNQILPTLRFFFNPKVEKALFKFSEISALI